VFTVGLVNDYVALRSDFEPIKARMDAMESKAAPAAVDAYTKTECDSKFLTLVDVNQYAYKADVYTKRQTDDLFMRIDQAFSKTDFDNQMALMLYSRKQVDDRIAAINPLGSPSIAELDARYATKADTILFARQQDVMAALNNYALKSEVPNAGAWKALPLRAGFSTAAATGRQAQYRIQFGYIEMRGEVNRTGDYAVDTEYTFADIPAADRPKEWVYGNGATYNGSNPALPGVCHVGVKSTGEVIAVPLVRAAIRLYLDNVRVSTFK
jgi:hypothetical protein